MKTGFLSIVLTLFFSVNTIHTESVKSLYIFKDPLKSNTTAIKTSGFNTLIVFAVDIQRNGDILYPLSHLGGGAPDVVLSTRGIYVGGAKLAELIRSYKNGTTNVTRVEVTLGPAMKVRDMIQEEGTGPDSLLYRNIEALKDAWHIDAINNDDEVLYDIQSTVQFAKMVDQMGLRYTIAPYTNLEFWKVIVKQLHGKWAGLLDRVYLQCYDGGANNDPSQWQDALGMRVIPLLWVVNGAKAQFGRTPEQARSQFLKWNELDKVAGGGFWNNYDIEKQNSSYKAYGDALNKAFGFTSHDNHFHGRKSNYFISI